MWVLIGLLILMGTLLGLLAYWRSQKQNEKPMAQPKIDDECCGQHAVCERDSLLNKTPEIIYYDDEELDVLSGVSPINFTEEQLALLEGVFYTLQEKDVAGWLRSLQMRNIQLPSDLREEALLIVSERRSQ